MIELTLEQRLILQEILQRNIPERKVMLFGSRVTGDAKHFSDLDIVVMGEVPLSTRVLRQLRDDFDDSRFPFQIDIVDWAATPEAFRSIIMESAVAWKEVAAMD